MIDVERIFEIRMQQEYYILSYTELFCEAALYFFRFQFFNFR